MIHGNISDSLNRTDRKLGAITIFAAGQMAVIKFISPEGALSYISLLALCAVLPAGVFGISPFIETPKPLPPLDQVNKPRSADSLLNEHDIAGYSQLELVSFLDRYLGGGITATPYYEDIVAQIVIGARIATRKRRIFGSVCAMTLVAQLCLLARLLMR